MIDGQRIKNLAKQKNLTLKDISDRTSMNLGTLYNIVHTGKTSLSTVNKIAEALGVTTDYLMSSTVEEEAGIYGSTRGNITYVPISAQAGFFIGYGQDKLKLTHFSLPEMSEGSYYAFSVNGDSMSPTIKSGDIVVCSKLNSKDEIKPNAVHVMFDKTDGVVVKRLVVQDAVIRCISDNEKYPEYNMKTQTVKDVYRVRRVITSNI